MSSSLQICRFSHLHTLTPSDSQTRICSNLLTLISVVRNSQIFSPAVLQNFFFSSCKLLARSTWDLLSFTPCPVLLHAKKTNPQEQRFPVLLLGKNRTTGAENPVPIGSKGQCSFNPKTDLQEKEHFFQCGEKLVRVELTMRLRRGEEKGGPVLLFEAKNRPTGREISAPPETLFITSWYITPSLFLVQTLERKKTSHTRIKNFVSKHSHSQPFSPTHRHGPESSQTLSPFSNF